MVRALLVRTPMSLLPREYLQTTVAIEAASVDGESTRYRTIGTGFFMAIEDGDGSGSSAPTHRLFLVTNRHLVEKSSLLIRVNRKGGAARRVQLSLKDGEGRIWAAHPEPAVDIAVVLVNARLLGEEDLEFNYFRPSDVAFVPTMKALDIGPGQELFVLGFPMGLSGVERNYVIARAGIIARFDEEILAASRSFLIDASVFPGNSGGPVVIKPSAESLEGLRPITQAYLIGVVRSYLPYEEVAYSLQADPPVPRMVFMENSGLADVIPIDCVKEAADLLTSRPERSVAAAPLTKAS